MVGHGKGHCLLLMSHRRGPLATLLLRLLTRGDPALTGGRRGRLDRLVHRRGPARRGRQRIQIILNHRNFRILIHSFLRFHVRCYRLRLRASRRVRQRSRLKGFLDWQIEHVVLGPRKIFWPTIVLRAFFRRIGTRVIHKHRVPPKTPPSPSTTPTRPSFAHLTLAPAACRALRPSAQFVEVGGEGNEEADDRSCKEGRAALSRAVALAADACVRPKPIHGVSSSTAIPFKFWM